MRTSLIKALKHHAHLFLLSEKAHIACALRHQHRCCRRCRQLSKDIDMEAAQVFSHGGEKCVDVRAVLGVRRCRAATGHHSRWRADQSGDKGDIKHAAKQVQTESAMQSRTGEGGDENELAVGRKLAQEGGKSERVFLPVLKWDKKYSKIN